METNKMYDVENPNFNDVSRSSLAPADRRLFLAGALALTLATIPANVELAEAQAASGVSSFCVRFSQVDCPIKVSAN